MFLVGLFLLRLYDYKENNVLVDLSNQIAFVPSFDFKFPSKGLIYGAAIGDAIGVACRWMSDDEINFYLVNDNELTYDKIVQDEHRILWRQGDWTSNFDQFVSEFCLLLF